MSQQLPELRRHVLQVDVMAKTMVPRHAGTRLARVEFPGMKIEHDRLALTGIDALDAMLKPQGWQHPKVATAAQRQVRPEEPYRTDRELDQPLVTMPPQFVGEARRLDLPVTIVPNRVDAGIVVEARLHQEIISPGLLAANGVVGGAIAQNRLPRDVLQASPRQNLLDTSADLNRPSSARCASAPSERVRTTTMAQLEQAIEPEA